MSTKVCRICNETKSLDEFLFRKDSQKHRSECKACLSKKNKEWRDKPKTEKEVLPDHKIRCKKCNEIKDDIEFAIRSDTGLRRNQCILCRNAYVAAFKRSESYREKDRAHVKKRRETDIHFYLKSRLRGTLGTYLRKCNVQKSSHTIDLVGCSIEELKQHIAKQFTGDMSWEKRNFVIDHIIPISYFDLTNPLHQEVCFHYTNLQPLTWEENAKKSDKILPQHMEFFNLVKSKLGTNVDSKVSTGRENNSESKNPTDETLMITKRKLVRKVGVEMGNPQPSS